MKSINMISTIVLIFISSIYANNGIYNQIENDHRIRNFAFIGPFPKTFNGDSLINIINSVSFMILSYFELSTCFYTNGRI